MSLTKRQAARIEYEMTEKELRESIQKAAQDLGWHYHYTWTQIHSSKGCPDLELLRDGKMFRWELKSQKGKVTDEQHEYMSFLGLVPGIDVRVVRPSNLEQAYRALVEGDWVDGELLAKTEGVAP